MQPATIDPTVHARRWKTLAVLALSLVIIGLDNTILNVALPTLQKEFDASSSTLQWMVDSYLLVFAGLLLVFGTLGDRFGRKLALQAGVTVFGLASLGALIADTANEVILIRALMGVGAALIMPATLSIIANVFPPEERGKAIGIWAALAAIGIGLGPLAGGLLIEWFDWSAVFLVNVPVALVAVLLGLWLVPESRDPKPGSFDVAGAALSTAGFSVLVYAVIEAPERGWSSGLILGLLAGAIALLAAFVWWERRAAQPMLDLGFFRNARFSVGTLAVSVAFFSLLGGIFALTQYLQFAHGYSAIEAGAVMTPLALGLIMGAGSSSQGGRADRDRAGGGRRPHRPRHRAGHHAPVGRRHQPPRAAAVGLLPRPLDGLGDGTRHGSRGECGAGRQVRRRLGHEHGRPDGVGRARRRRRRLPGELALRERRRARAERSAGARPRSRRRVDRRRQRRRRRTAARGRVRPCSISAGDAFVDAMATGLVVAAALSAAAAVIVARTLSRRPVERVAHAQVSIERAA